jgi:hypothetical protein
VTCALCGQSNPLRDSHVIPEFMYRPLYDEKHRLWVLSAVGPKPASLEQKGLREKLLCDACEGRLNPWETYTARLFSKEIAVTAKRIGDLVWVNGVDYSKFKLFQLSILWRAGVSHLPFFSKVKLGRHADVLKRQLLSGDPGSPIRYGCALFAHTTPTGVDAGLIVQPTLAKIEGRHVYNFVFGGLTWLFFVSNHTVPRELSDSFIQPAGRFAFLAEESFGPKYIAHLAERYHAKRGAKGEQSGK